MEVHNRDVFYYLDQPGNNTFHHYFSLEIMCRCFSCRELCFIYQRDKYNIWNVHRGRGRTSHQHAAIVCTIDKISNAYW